MMVNGDVREMSNVDGIGRGGRGGGVRVFFVFSSLRLGFWCGSGWVCWKGLVFLGCGLSWLGCLGVGVAFLVFGGAAWFGFVLVLAIPLDGMMFFKASLLHFILFVVLISMRAEGGLESASGKGECYL